MASLILCFFVFGTLGANLRVAQVSSQSNVRNEYLPPFMIANLLVNVSSSFFDENIIKASQKTVNDAIATQQTKDSIRYALASVIPIKEFEKGQVILHLSLRASTGSAVITPTRVLSADSIEQADIVSHSMRIQKLERYFTVDVEYPSDLIISQENQTEEKPRIAWENFYEEKMNLKDFLEDREMTSSNSAFPFSYVFYDNFEKGEIEAPTIVVSDSVVTSSTEVKMKEFEVSKNLFKTLFHWTVEALGIDSLSDETKKIKSVLGESIEIENLIPYETVNIGSGFMDQFSEMDIGDANVYMQPRSVDIFDPASPISASMLESIAEAIRIGRVDKVQSILTDLSGTALDGVNTFDDIITILNSSGMSEEMEVETDLSNGRIGFFISIVEKILWIRYAIMGFVVLTLAIIGMLVIRKMTSNQSGNDNV